MRDAQAAGESLVEACREGGGQGLGESHRCQPSTSETGNTSPARSLAALNFGNAVSPLMIETVTRHRN